VSWYPSQFVLSFWFPFQSYERASQHNVSMSSMRGLIVSILLGGALGASMFRTSTTRQNDALDLDAHSSESTDASAAHLMDGSFSGSRNAAERTERFLSDAKIADIMDAQTESNSTSIDDDGEDNESRANSSDCWGRYTSPWLAAC
jgi:hypothetical protein